MYIIPIIRFLNKKNYRVRSYKEKDAAKTVASVLSQKKEITIQNGLSKEQCKKIHQFIKTSKIKVQAQTQKESVRVSGKKKDDLQNLINILKEQEN